MSPILDTSLITKRGHAVVPFSILNNEILASHRDGSCFLNGYSFVRVLFNYRNYQSQLLNNNINVLFNLVTITFYITTTLIRCLALTMNADEQTASAAYIYLRISFVARAAAYLQTRHLVS